MRSPSIRAGFLQSNVSALEALGAEVAAAVRARIGADRLAYVEEASRIAWLPLDLDLALVEAVVREAGEPGLRTWIREGVARSSTSALLSPFLASTRALFGLSPHGVLRSAPRMWNAIYRDCGSAVYGRVADREARMVLDGAPALMLGSAAEVDQLAIGLEAAIGLARAMANVEPELEGERAFFRCRW